MKQLSIREMRHDLTHIDEVLAKECEVIITRRGKPIARVLPIINCTGIPSRAAHRATLPRLKKSSTVYIREDRNAR